MKAAEDYSLLLLHIHVRTAAKTIVKFNPQTSVTEIAKLIPLKILCNGHKLKLKNDPVSDAGMFMSMPPKIFYVEGLEMGTSNLRCDIISAYSLRFGSYDFTPKANANLGIDCSYASHARNSYKRVSVAYYR